MSNAELIEKLKVKYSDIQINFNNKNAIQAAIDEIMKPSGTDYSTYKLRNIAILDTVPTEMNDGDIALVYIKEE